MEIEKIVKKEIVDNYGNLLNFASEVLYQFTRDGFVDEGRFALTAKSCGLLVVRDGKIVRSPSAIAVGFGGKEECPTTSND